MTIARTMVFTALALFFASGTAIAQKDYTDTHGERSDKQDVVCGAPIYPALTTFTEQTFPRAYFPKLNVTVYKKNDEKCESDVLMFNVAIVAQNIPGDIADGYYGIFHVHLGKDGALQSAASSTPWQPMPGGELTAVYQDWCLFIKAAYPEQASAQACY